MVDIWSILIIVFVFQGVFILVSVLTSSRRRRKKESTFLVLIVCMLLWLLLEFLFVRNKLDLKLTVFYGTRYGSWFLLGPLVLFYFKSITRKDWKFSKAHLAHFIPFALFVLVIPLLFEKVINERQVHYGMLSVFDHRKKVITPLQYVYSAIFIAQFLHLAYYLMNSLALVGQYQRLLRNEYARIDKNVNWLRAFLIAFVLILAFTSLFLFILFKTDIYRRHLDYLYVLPTGLLLYMIGYYLVDVNWDAVDKSIAKYANSSLNRENMAAYLQKLEGLLQNEKVYLNPGIRLKDLAEKMNISAHHLSQIINEQYQLSFFDFINKHRVETAKQLILENPDRLLIDIAFESGFNNKTSFVNAFKKFTNTTPSKFRG